MGATQEERVASLEIVNSEISDRLRVQLDSMDRRDTKAASLLALVGAAMAFLFAQPNRWWLLVPTAGAYLVSAWMLFQALRPREMKTVPDPNELINLYEQARTSDEYDLKETILVRSVATKRRAFNINHAVDAEKLRWWHHSGVALLVAVLLSILTLSAGSTSDGRGSDRGACRGTHYGTDHRFRARGQTAGHDGATRAFAEPHDRWRVPACGHGRGGAWPFERDDPRR